MHGRGKKLSKLKRQNKIINPCILEKKYQIQNNQRHYESFWNRSRKSRKKEIREKKNNNRLNKDKIIRGVKTVFEQDEDYYKPNRVSTFQNNNYIEYE